MATPARLPSKTAVNFPDDCRCRHVIELYADFSRARQDQTQLFVGTGYRFKLKELSKDKTSSLLRTIWAGITSGPYHATSLEIYT